VTTNVIWPPFLLAECKNLAGTAPMEARYMITKSDLIKRRASCDQLVLITEENCCQYSPVHVMNRNLPSPPNNIHEIAYLVDCI